MGFATTNCLIFNCGV